MVIKPISPLQREARIAGYAYRARGGDEDAADAAFGGWLDSIRHLVVVEEVEALKQEWRLGMAEYAPITPRLQPMLSPDDVATLKEVSVQSVYMILRDSSRRAKIFPSATFEGDGVRRTWRIPQDEAERWQPVRGRGRGRKAKGDE